MKKYLLKFILLSVISVFIISCNLQNNDNKTESSKAKAVFEVPERPVGQNDVLELRTEPIDTVRMAIIGVGMRGFGAVHRYNFIEGAKVVALCDVVPENVEKAQEILREAGKPLADEYTGAEDWKEIC